jgi:hypothetical protein
MIQQKASMTSVRLIKKKPILNVEKLLQDKTRETLFELLSYSELKDHWMWNRDNMDKCFKNNISVAAEDMLQLINIFSMQKKLGLL